MKKVTKDNDAQMMIIYRKVDGKIIRAGTLSPYMSVHLKETDLDIVWPGADKEQIAMVFVMGKKFLDIQKFHVELDKNGTFIDIVENAEVLTSSVDEQSEGEIFADLLNREPHIVISVLSVIDDKKRLAKYKELEEKGQGRVEVLNFFKQRGIDE